MHRFCSMLSKPIFAVKHLQDDYRQIAPDAISVLHHSPSVSTTATTRRLVVQQLGLQVGDVVLPSRMSSKIGDGCGLRRINFRYAGTLGVSASTTHPRFTTARAAAVGNSPLILDESSDHGLGQRYEDILMQSRYCSENSPTFQTT